MGLLRFFLACTVMLCHFYIVPLALSPIIVCCFFVISGDFLLLYSTTNMKTGYLAGCNIPIVVGWALAVELIFYFLSPFILRLKTPAMLALGAVSLLLNIFFAVLYSHHPDFSAFWMECLLPSNLYFFLLGAVAYRFYATYRHNKENASSAILWGWAIASVFFAALLRSSESFVTLNWIALYYTLPVITALLLPALFQASHQNRYDRWIGGLSYPLYLSHTIIGAYMLKIGANNTYAAFLIIFVVSIASYHFIEQPISRFRHRYFVTRQ